MLNMFPNFFASTSPAGMEYRSLPVQTPYSAAALAAQGGRYPATTMSVPNDWVYPVQGTSGGGYPAIEGPRYTGVGQGGYGQRGLLPGPVV